VIIDKSIVRNPSNTYILLGRAACVFQLLGFEVFQVRLQKKATSTVFTEIHKGAIFDRLKINIFVLKNVSLFHSTCFVQIALKMYK
jgi:hypothetical protein